MLAFHEKVNNNVSLDLKSHHTFFEQNKNKIPQKLRASFVTQWAQLRERTFLEREREREYGLISVFFVKSKNLINYKKSKNTDEQMLI